MSHRTSVAAPTAAPATSAPNPGDASLSVGSSPVVVSPTVVVLSPVVVSSTVVVSSPIVVSAVPVTVVRVLSIVVVVAGSSTSIVSVVVDSVLASTANGP